MNKNDAFKYFSENTKQNNVLIINRKKIMESAFILYKQQKIAEDKKNLENVSSLSSYIQKQWYFSDEIKYSPKLFNKYFRCLKNIIKDFLNSDVDKVVLVIIKKIQCQKKLFKKFFWRI